MRPSTKTRAARGIAALCMACILAAPVAGAAVEPAAETGRELYVAPSGSDSNTGSSAAPLRTLQKALDLVQPGGAVVLRGGAHVLGATAHTRRSGTAAAPITVRGATGEAAVIAGPSSSRGLQVNDDWYVIRDLRFRGADNLLWLDGASHVIVTASEFRDAGGECVRLKNQSRRNTFSRNTVERCGLEGFDAPAGRKNGEGVYIGTAPEQRYKNAPSGASLAPDRSDENVVEYNTFRTEGAEAVDIKEDAERNVVRYNRATDSRDPDGGVYGARGDGNHFIGNTAAGGVGAGFRFGGDTVRAGRYGQTATRTYGARNVLRGNRSDGNRGHGYKFMVSPQDADCSNGGSGNGGELYHFGATPFAIPCGGTAPAPTPQPTGTPPPAPTSTPTAPPTSTPPGSVPAPPSAGAPVLTFGAAADARVRADRRATNFGGETKVRIDTDPDTDAYLRFAVSGLNGRRVAAAKLRLYVAESGMGGVVRSLADAGWDERRITWANRPSAGGPVLARNTRKAPSGVWLSFDVSAAVRRDGVYAFALDGTDDDGLGFSSREAGAHRPQLVVTPAP